MFDYRKLMEALDAIENGEDVQQDSAPAAKEDVVGHLKDITNSIIDILDKLQSGDADMNEVCKDLQKASDILSALAYNDSTDSDEESDTTDDTSTDEVTEDVGVDGYEPTVDNQEHRSYKEKSAPSYSSRQGFTG
ncbi:hypothetical protein [Klebsiella phage phiKp_21]|nr:hypothetical protein DIDNDMLP_00501 [Klebsiella phage KP13-7]BEH88027.1 hypothetical protein [Klebsiella phage phiKp_21]